MRKILLIITLLTFQQSFTQEVCLNNQNTDYEEVNRISINKCAIKSSTNKKIKSNKVLVAKNYRFLKKRIKKSDFIKTRDLHKKVSELDVVFEHSEVRLVKEKINAMIPLLDKRDSNKTIPFNEVTVIPKFIDCENVNEDCFNENMKLHIQKNFSYPKEAIKNGIEGNLFISFIIDSNGNVKDIKVTSSKGMSILTNEAIRIVSLLPKFIPGKQDGHVTSVSYSFPMNFKLK